MAGTGVAPLPFPELLLSLLLPAWAAALLPALCSFPGLLSAPCPNWESTSLCSPVQLDALFSTPSPNSLLDLVLCFLLCLPLCCLSPLQPAADHRPATPVLEIYMWDACVSFTLCCSCPLLSEVIFPVNFSVAATGDGSAQKGENEKIKITPSRKPAPISCA